MKLALILGKQQGNSIKPKLQDVKDNLDIDCYGTVPEFINMALKRNTTYDRILVLSNLINSALMRDLYNYWNSSSCDTQVVMLCKKDIDDAKATEFLQVFKTPLAAAMLVTTTTLQIVAEAVLRPTTEITNEYGIKDFLNVEVDEDIYVEPVKEIVKEVTPQESIVEAPKKKGFFSGLFGSKPQKVQDKVQEHEVQVSTPTSNPNSQSLVQKESTEDISNIELDDESKAFGMEFSSNVSIVEMNNSGSITTPDSGNIPNSQPIQNLNTSSDIQEEQTSITENSDVNSDSSSLVEVNVDFSGFSDDGFEDVEDVTNDFTPDEIVDMDFGADISDYSQADNSVSKSISTASSVDTDLGDMNVASAEEQYRQAEEAPKVVTKTVVREVIRNVNNDLSTLDSVLSGRKKKTIVVTGDRGTGVTSTALTIAQALAKKVPVLYFDCDIENHGLLNYIDYNRFCNYEESHKNGIKRCRTKDAFRSCVLSFDNNLDILTTDFSCEASIEDLTRAHEVVAEMATNYSVVIIDCPVSKLSCIEESLITGETVLCVEASKRGFMNMLTQMDLVNISNRYKRKVATTGMMFVTKCTVNLDLEKLVNYIKAFVELEDADYLSMTITPFNGKITDKLLNDVMEG